MRIGLIYLLVCALTGVDLLAGVQVKLSVETNRRYYSDYTDEKAYVLSTIAANVLPGDSVSHPRLNVVLVIDRSGSMVGEPIEWARRAALEAIDVLSPEDYFSVVLFGSEVETLVESGTVRYNKMARESISRIVPAGGTSLYDGLSQGAAQLRRNAGPGTVDHIVLISDGKPNKGPREAEDFIRLARVFAGEGISVSTIGIGSEFDEDLLVEIARIGNADYRYLPDLAKLPDSVGSILRNCRMVVARDVELVIDYRRRGARAEALGWHYGESDGRVVRYRFPYLRADQDLEVLSSAEIRRLPLSSQMAINEFALIKLSWKPLGEDSAPHEALSRAVRVDFTSSPNHAARSSRAVVYRRMAEIHLRSAFQKAIEELDKGNPAGAIAACKRALGELNSLNDDLKDPEINAWGAGLKRLLEETDSQKLIHRKALRSGLLSGIAPPSAFDRE